MTKIGKRLIKTAKEAVSIARGDAGFTPGPWGIPPSGWGTGSDGGGSVEAMRPTGKYVKNDDGTFSPEVPTHGTHICYFSSQRLPNGEGFANARLIAAAPDMYEALVTIQKNCARLLDLGTEEDHSFQEIDEIARAAIIKAQIGK